MTIDLVHTSIRSVGLFFAHNLAVLPLELPDHIDYLNPELLQAFIQLASSSHLELADRISYLNPELLPHTEIIHVGFNEYRMAIYDLLADKDYYNGLHRHVRWQRVK